MNVRAGVHMILKSLDIVHPPAFNIMTGRSQEGQEFDQLHVCSLINKIVPLSIKRQLVKRLITLHN